MKLKHLALLALAVGFLSIAAPADAQIWFDGNIYMKFLWGTDRLGTALYAFTAIPGEGLGDSGQGTQIELFVNGKLGKKIQFKGSLQSRFIRNYWTNFGGFHGQDCAGGILTPNPNCLGSEFDPRSNQYVKLRNASIVITPGYDWLDRAWFGENDLSGFDPWVIGRARYIDRFNPSVVMLSGSANNRKFTWDVVRLSNDVFRGPNFTTGDYQPQDGTWGFQPRLRISPQFDVNGIVAWVRDIEIDPKDFFTDDGRDIRSRFTNTVGGVVAGIHPSTKFDVKGSFYFSQSDSDLNLNGIDTDEVFGFAPSAFSPVILGDRSDASFKVNADINDPFENGLSFQMEYFNIGEDYVSFWAARREVDVLITEGFDGAFTMTGPANGRFGIFGGSGDAPQPGPPTRVTIGYGGWSGSSVQVVTINADNQFTDFDEPWAETVVGWKGFTVKPLFATGNWDIQGEFSYIGYNTNWQMWDDDTLTITASPYPMFESDTGVGHADRNAYAPFRDRQTTIAVARAKYSFANGLEVWGKYKRIDETDDRMTDPRFLPFAEVDCPGGGVPCTGVRNNYGTDLNGNPLSTADFYGNPPVITGANGELGYQWKPFDSVTDDDRDLEYNVIHFGAGKQIHPDFYASAQYEYYNVDLFDGTTAFQAYQLHEMAGGKHKKNKLIFVGRYILPGLPEAGFQMEHNWGTFEPNFGGGFVPQAITTEAQARDHHFPIGTLGFFGRFGGFNTIEKREFSQTRFKGYVKILF